MACNCFPLTLYHATVSFSYPYKKAFENILEKKVTFRTMFFTLLKDMHRGNLLSDIFSVVILQMHLICMESEIFTHLEKDLILKMLQINFFDDEVD